MVTDRLLKKFSQSKQLDWQGLVFYDKYTIRENSYFSELLPSRGVPKTPEALENATFSIWWFIHPLATKTHSIFPHLPLFISI